MLGDAVDVYLDAGPAPGAVPSTIVDATSDILLVRRQGVIDRRRRCAQIVSNFEVAEPD